MDLVQPPCSCGLLCQRGVASYARAVLFRVRGHESQDHVLDHRIQNDVHIFRAVRDCYKIPNAQWEKIIHGTLYVFHGME